ncbi:MAG TPA: hypothetical protein VFS00_12510 [Polyangiaceae bacterium]|nr:hypothetical protein [Polyangiaceae bacterium]
MLFIGNSYTYYNNLPEVFAQLASAGGQGPAEIRMVAPGGATLGDHWQKNDALLALRGGRWTHVVLQDQSTLGVSYLLDGKPRVSTDEVFQPWAARWAAEAAKAGTTALFYLTWARRDSPDDQAALNHAYMRAAREARAAVAPVGLAWARVREQQPSLALFDDDGSHPSPAGTYLAACVFYASIFDLDPSGLPGTVRGVPVDQKTAKPEPDKTAVLVDLPPEQARALQGAAWATTQELKRAGGYLDAPPVPAPSPAPLPPGAPLAGVRLEGPWRGELRFSPTGPAQMALQLSRQGDAWKGHLELRFGSPKVRDESFDLGDLRVGERELTFSDPKGPEGLVVRFRGASTRADELCGMADATMTAETPPGRRLGSWCLHRP